MDLVVSATLREMVDKQMSKNDNSMPGIVLTYTYQIGKAPLDMKTHVKNSADMEIFLDKPASCFYEKLIDNIIKEPNERISLNEEGVAALRWLFVTMSDWKIGTDVRGDYLKKMEFRLGDIVPCDKKVDILSGVLSEHEKNVIIRNSSVYERTSASLLFARKGTKRFTINISYIYCGNHFLTCDVDENRKRKAKLIESARRKAAKELKAMSKVPKFAPFRDIE